MKTLNLVYPDKSDIKYQIQKFPDGQQNIVIESFDIYYEDAYLPKPIEIKSRLNNWLDLELIVCAVASLRELGVEELHLYTPYMVGGRSDRKFEEGGNNYLRDVICPIINSLNFKTVTCIDPHSDVLEACIKGFKKESNNRLLAYFFQDYDSNNEKDYIFISPDAGASKKIYKLAEQIGYKGDIITCSKDRDTKGNVTKTVVLINGEHVQKDIIIIDDVCDGGATFINITKEIKKRISDMQQHEENSELTYGKIYLIVTHGIFSKRYKELNKYFDGIYCTNSYKDIADNEYGEITNIKQLNIF